MQVKIKQASEDGLWYSDQINNVFNVYCLDEMPYYIVPIPIQYWSKFHPCLFIFKKDCEVVQ